MPRPTLQLPDARWVRLIGDTDEAIVRLLIESGIHQEAQEVFVVVPIRADLATVGPVEVARGGFDRMSVHVPSVLAAVLSVGCERFCVAHNHPTDDPVASDEDARLETRLGLAAQAAGLGFGAAYIVTPSGRWTMTINQGGVRLAAAAAPRRFR